MTFIQTIQGWLAADLDLLTLALWLGHLFPGIPLFSLPLRKYFSLRRTFFLTGMTTMATGLMILHGSFWVVPGALAWLTGWYLAVAILWTILRYTLLLREE